jgi:hypothetical protein
MTRHWPIDIEVGSVPMTETGIPQLTGMATRPNGERACADPETGSGSLAVLGSRATTATGVCGGIKQLSEFDTGLGSELPIDKIGGSRPAEAVRRRVVAPPVRYVRDDG